MADEVKSEPMPSAVSKAEEAKAPEGAKTNPPEAKKEKPDNSSTADPAVKAAAQEKSGAILEHAPDADESKDEEVEAYSPYPKQFSFEGTKKSDVQPEADQPGLASEGGTLPPV